MSAKTEPGCLLAATKRTLLIIRDANRERTVFAALTCTAVLAVATLSFLPKADKAALHTRGRFHSVGHFALFGIVAYVAGRAARSWQGRFLLFLGVIVLGFGIELGEHLVYGTLLEWSDVLLDAVGVVGGTLVALYGTISGE